MGFFNKILKGLGFEDEEEVTPKQKPKDKKVKKENVTASYDLDKYTDLEKFENEEKSEKEVQETEAVETQTTSLDFELIKVKSQVEVQQVVQKIRSGQSILMNVEQLSTIDLTRSLDFVSGAVFALGLKLQKVDDKLYLIK